jgi:hypothetical protein
MGDLYIPCFVVERGAARCVEEWEIRPGASAPS